MKFFYETYINTIDPKSDFKVLKSKEVYNSIIIHLILYLISYKVLIYIFDIKDNSLIVSIILLIIMSSGYYFRLARSKSIFEFHLQKGIDEEKSRELALNQINHAYFTWYFLG